MHARYVLAGLAMAGAAVTLAACGGSDDNGGSSGGYAVTKLVADADTTGAKYTGEDIAAASVDAALKNPWGIAFNPQGFVWVANNHTDTATLYDGNGAKQDLEVTLPDEAEPTGIVFNGGEGFVISEEAGAARFIFAGEGGALAAWSPATGTEAVTVFTADDGAAYTGLAIAGNRLYAADFHNGKVDVFDETFARLAPSGFTDPNLPDGFSPFGIQVLGQNVYVAYAQIDEEGEDEVPGPGLGVVDRYDLNGGALQRLVSNGNGSALDAPWGMVLAPGNFGAFSGDLLVGNFGDGRINAFDPNNGALLGTLTDSAGMPIVLDGLWGLAFGNGINDQPTNTLFFAAGVNDEENGIYGRIDCNGC